MPELNGPGDFLPVETSPKIPSGLNVLTILTFIGSGLAFLGSIYNFFNAKKGLDQMEATINSPNFDSMPALAKKFMSPEALELARKSYENRVPINIITIIALALCVVGAYQMRKLKAQGYIVYVIGEVLPLVGSLIFLGVSALTGGIGIFSIILVLLFVLLYTAQRKYLINK